MGAQDGHPPFGEVEAWDAEDSWRDPDPLGGPPLPPFPSHALPSWLRAWVEAQAEALQVPTDLPGLLALSVISTTAAKRSEIAVRKGWVEPLNIYLLVALPSGTRKSVVFEAATEPLVAFEMAQIRRERVAIPIPEEAVAAEARLRLVVADGAGTTETVQASTTTTPKVCSFANDASEKDPWRVFISDATPERITSLLSENAGRLAVLSDEGEICNVIAGRYGGSIEVFLKAHSGQVLTVERQNRSRVHVRKPALTLGLAVQPSVLQALAMKPSVRERGLLARFLVALPESRVGYRTIAPPPVPDDINAQYFAKISTLLERANEVDENNDIESMFSLSDEAQQFFNRYEERIESSLRPDGLLSPVTSWGSKLPGAVARMAGLLHIAAHNDDDDVIDASTMEDAISLGDYFVPHALAAFGRSTGVDLSGAIDVIRWIKENGKYAFTKRELHQSLRHNFFKARELDQPLHELEERGYIRREPEEKRAGRPSHRYVVHPSVRSLLDQIFECY